MLPGNGASTPPTRFDDLAAEPLTVARARARSTASGERFTSRSTSAPDASRVSAETPRSVDVEAVADRGEVGAGPTAAAHPLERHEEVVGRVGDAARLASRRGGRGSRSRA